MVVDFEGTPPIRTSTGGGDQSTSTKSTASLLSPFGLLGTAAWFGGGGTDQFDSEPSEEEKAAEDAARKVVSECNVRGILLERFFIFLLKFYFYFYSPPLPPTKATFIPIYKKLSSVQKTCAPTP